MQRGDGGDEGGDCGDGGRGGECDRDCVSGSESVRVSVRV